ncbi:MAG: paraquat-inducible protein B, partial [Planctomycetota bacterium]
MTTNETPTDPKQEDIPEALILPPRKRSYSSASVAVLIPIIAILFAAWYGVRAWDQRGLEIDIHFADGHGIKAGDSLRFHGISVGQVEAVTLDKRMQGVDVQVQLMESSRALAKTGTRFWIVRPQVEFAGITGLDTVLGAHYLNVAPGPQDAAPRQSFTGLEEPPVDVAPGSLELVLEATDRGSARRGSPVTWRRTPVGQVLSAELSSDARVVEVRIAIRPEYASLVLENSRFFEVGGLS